ncbi:MAG: flavodoxin family protein [Velocimicrobium sp.]
MKALVVYYSLEGNTKYVVDQIRDYLKADTLCLEPVKEYPKGSVSKFVWGGKSVVFGETPKLKPYKFSEDRYDMIIIGTPVWAGSFVPPIKTFLKENKLSDKKIAFFACSTSGNVTKCFEKLKQQVGVENVVAKLSLIDPKVKKSEENVKKIKAFCDKL